MDDQDRLLVRVYNVGFGDCIYLRVPDKYEEGGTTELQHRHILIDCGSRDQGGLDKPLKKALDDVHKMLPKVNGKKCLDLLVVTHLHADHLNGFYRDWFKGITVRHVWLTVHMNKGHPQAEKSHALQALALRATLSLLQQGLHLGPGVRELLLSRLTNDETVKLLSETLPKGSEPGKPLYVCSDIADPDPNKKGRLSAQERRDHRVEFKRGTTCYTGFHEHGTTLRVLAPEWDIDGYYLGRETCDFRSLFQHHAEPENPQALLAAYEHGQAAGEGAARMHPMPQPGNISQSDFRSLRNRLLYSALSFSQKDNELKNNTSVVLLLEWRGLRLLFTGDAEWKGGYDKDRDRNSCWDVLLWMDKKQGHLSKPLDFLKVGHHGSVNATPWKCGAAKQSILDRMLPKEHGAVMVVSTLKTNMWPNVPCPGLVEKELRSRGQVLRTDRAEHLSGSRYIQLTLDAAPGYTP